MVGTLGGSAHPTVSMGWGTPVICLAVSFQDRIVAACYVRSKRGSSTHSIASREEWGVDRIAGGYTLARSRATARTDSAISKPTTSRIWLSVTRIVTSTLLDKVVACSFANEIARFLQLCNPGS
jgi:hypothetical protein